MAKGELIYQGQTRLGNHLALSDKFSVKDKDIKRYKSLMKEGQDVDAIDEFVDEYMSAPSDAYKSTMQRYLGYAEKGEMTRKDSRSVETSVALMTITPCRYSKEKHKEICQRSTITKYIFEE